MKNKTCDFLINIHQLPADLVSALEDKTNHLYETALLYQKLVNLDLLWKVWWIDEYGKYWLEINFIRDNHTPEFHTIAIDEGTFTKISFEEYVVL